MKISKELLELVPYKAGKPISETKREYGLTEVFKLASNENPLGPSPKAIVAIQQALQNQHRYPDPSAFDLLNVLSDVWGFETENLGVGNGSDELIDLLTRIYCEPGDSILTSEASFAAYPISAQANRVRTIRTPMTSDYKFDVEALVKRVEQASSDDRIRLVFIANPNNPTGTFITRSEVNYILQKLGSRDDLMLVFDEAYTEFVRSEDYLSAIESVRSVKNLIVLRTFSKAYGLAGLRVGAMIAPKQTIEIFNRVRKPFNVNDLAQVAVIAAIKDHEFIQRSRDIVWKGLDYFYESLQKINLPYIPSQGNFVLFDTQREASLVNEALLRKGIIMRPVQNYGFKTHLRLSVGLEHENQAAMKALEEVIRLVPKL